MSKFNPPQLLDSLHDLASFDCGKAPLNEFLRLHALDKQKAKLLRTYVVTQADKVVGYYTLAHISVESELAPKKLGRGMPRSIPAMLMARFAVDASVQGLGLGRSLFADAMHRVWAVIETGAAPVRIFVVDALDEEAKAFYKRFDMVAGQSDPMRLYLSYKTIIAAFE